MPLEAEAWLQKTIDKTPACVETIESVKLAIASGDGMLFLVHEDGKLYGAIFTAIEENYFNLGLLGGIKFSKWKETLRHWVYKIKAETSLTVIIISRKGWKKVFPELREIGSVFEF